MLTNSVSQPPALKLPPVSVAASGSNGQGSCLAPCPRDYLIWVTSYKKEILASEALYVLHTRYKEGPVKDAIWEGYWALRESARECVRQACKTGQLLNLVVA